MRIAEAAAALSTTPRVLRYREALGLLPARAAGRRAGRHRRYDAADLRAVALGRALEERYDVPPAALAFALRALTEPEVATRVRALAEATGRAHAPGRVLDFDQEKAERLLDRRAAGRAQPAGRGSGASTPRSTSGSR